MINGENVTEMFIDGKVRKAKKASDGYMHFWLSDGTSIKVHRAVMERHIGRKLTKDEHIHHIDGDRTNNSLSNLRLMTRGEHSKLHRKQEIKEGKILFGNNNEKRKKKIKGTNRDGKTIFFDSFAEARQNGFSHAFDCCKGNRKTDKGYRWEYVNGN